MEQGTVFVKPHVSMFWIVSYSTIVLTCPASESLVILPSWHLTQATRQMMRFDVSLSLRAAACCNCHAPLSLNVMEIRLYLLFVSLAAPPFLPGCAAGPAAAAAYVRQSGIKLCALGADGLVLQQAGLQVSLSIIPLSFGMVSES